MANSHQIVEYVIVLYIIYLFGRVSYNICTPPIPNKIYSGDSFKNLSVINKTFILAIGVPIYFFIDILPQMISNLLIQCYQLLQNSLIYLSTILSQCIEWTYKHIICPLCPMIRKLCSTLNSMCRQLINIISPILSRMKHICYLTLDFIWENIVPRIKYAFNLAVDLLNDLSEIIRINIIRPLLSQIKHTLTIIFDFIIDVSELIWKNIVHPILLQIKYIFNLVINQIIKLHNNFVLKVIHPIVSNIKYMYQLVINHIHNLSENIWKHIVYPALLNIKYAAEIIWKNILYPTWVNIKYASSLTIDFITNLSEIIWKNIVYPSWINIKYVSGLIIDFLWKNIVYPSWLNVKYISSLTLDVIINLSQIIWENIIYVSNVIVEIIWSNVMYMSQMILPIWLQFNDYVLQQLTYLLFITMQAFSYVSEQSYIIIMDSYHFMLHKLSP